MDWGFIISVTFTGLVVVFIILILLVVILYGMGILMNSSGKKQESGLPDVVLPPSTDNIPPAADYAAEVYDTDDEITAVITAAIMAFSENESKRRFGRKPGREGTDRVRRTAWAKAGISENTKPF